MTTRAEFTEEQWKLLVAAPRCAVMGVVLIDFGLVDFAKEAAAMVRFAQQAQATYGDNPLIQSVLAESAGIEGQTGWHVPWRRLGEDVVGLGGARPERLADECLARIQAAVDVLRERAEPGEAQEFKEFLFAYADRVARASGEGLLGRGERVSRKERGFLQRLERVLGL